MPPKKAAGTTTAKKVSTPAEHAPYKDMIKEAILQLKERNGSSRQAIKKYVLNNNKGIKESNFDTQFNAAIKRGVNSGDFVQPKGPSGPVKLQKKDAAKSTTKTPKSTGEKSTKKAAPKKTVAPKKATATTATKAAKPKAAAKPKSTANTKKPRKTSTSTEKTASMNKTKTGRVSKASKPATKKATAPKKAASKKKSTESTSAPAATSE